MARHPQSGSYTVAVLADIHGNLAALEAVLADLATQSYDQLVIAGDLVMNGPHPAETLACIRGLHAPTLFGETDRAVVDASSGNSEQALAHWTAEQIGTSGIAYLDALAFSQTVNPSHNASPEHELLIIHATPANVAAFLILQPNPLDARFVGPTPEAEALGMLGETPARTIVHGHVHYASSGFVRKQQVHSIGAVGFPFDGNPQAAYALATWDGGHWELIHRRVSYDYESVIAALTHSGQPQASTMAHRLRTAQWCPPLA